MDSFGCYALSHKHFSEAGLLDVTQFFELALVLVDEGIELLEEVAYFGLFGKFFRDINIHSRHGFLAYSFGSAAAR
jgi:hypothetical protein